MTEKILIILLPLVYLGTFIARNLIVKGHTQQRIRASDPLLTASIAVTTLSIFLAILSTWSEGSYRLVGAISFFRSPWVSHAGLILFGISIVMGWIFSAQLKESWRVGVHRDQKTELIRAGIYARLRNPYFVSYFIMFLGLFLVRPSIAMAGLVTVAVTLYHRMVLKEEACLLTLHGKEYENYRNETGRYWPQVRKGIRWD